MKCLRFLVPTLAVLAAAWAGVPNPSNSEPVTDASLVKLASDLTKLTRVTKKPVEMDRRTAVMCAPGNFPPHTAHSTLLPKGETATIHVFVTLEGAAAMKERTATFEPGTVILKQKFALSNEKAPVLYTGMLKREKGFNPDCGDWEFFTLSGDAKTVTSRGRLESCMKCHQAYPQSDFVTKKYTVGDIFDL